MPTLGPPGSAIDMDAVFSRLMLTLMPVAIILYSWIWYSHWHVLFDLVFSDWRMVCAA